MIVLITRGPFRYVISLTHSLPSLTVRPHVMESPNTSLISKLRSESGVNYSLSKSNLVEINSKFNLEVTQRILHDEPQTAWIQVQIKTRCDSGPTCKIPIKPEVPRYIEFKFQSNLVQIGSLNFNSDYVPNFEKLQ
jgi:hypothetical protein